MPSHDQLRFEFTSEPKLISTARLFAAAAARYFGCDEDVVQDVKIAVSEACTNAVKAHAALSADVPVRVVVHGEDERIRFEVIDAGAGFDRNGDAPAGETIGESGVGLQIIETLFPGATISANVDGGSTVSFSTARAG